MSLFSTLYGGGSGAPIGAITTGNISPGGDWLKLDNILYNKADYPDLDTSKMLTFDGQSIQTGPTLAAAAYYVTHCGGTVWYAHKSSGVAGYMSTDNGVTWTPVVTPADPGGGWGLRVANGKFFFTNASGATSVYYTSTDLVSWTAHSFVTASMAVSTIAYMPDSGYYVAVPAYKAGSPLYSQYSADGITWLLTTMYTGGPTFHFYGYGVGARRATYATNTGLVCCTQSVGGGAEYLVFSTRDGVTWHYSYLYPPPTYAYPIGFPQNQLAAEDAFGNLSDTGAVLLGGAHTTALKPKPSAAGGAPIGASNLHWGGTFVSEDHGETRHKWLATVGGTSYSTDFSGSRLLGVTTGGVVSWIDVNPTKFRACPVPSYLTGGSATQYIKAR